MQYYNWSDRKSSRGRKTYVVIFLWFKDSLRYFTQNVVVRRWLYWIEKRWDICWSVGVCDVNLSKIVTEWFGNKKKRSWLGATKLLNSTGQLDVEEVIMSFPFSITMPLLFSFDLFSFYPFFTFMHFSYSIPLEHPFCILHNPISPFSLFFPSFNVRKRKRVRCSSIISSLFHLVHLICSLQFNYC